MESGHIVLSVLSNANTGQGSVYLDLPAVNSSRGLRNRVHFSHRMVPFKEFCAECTDIPALWVPRRNSRLSPASFISQNFTEHQP